MAAKLWKGNLALVDYMIKSYHRYVKQTSQLQTQAQQLISERRGNDAADKVKEDDREIEDTVLRSRVRLLETDIDAMQSNYTALVDENLELRRIINEFIRSDQYASEESQVEFTEPLVTSSFTGLRTGESSSPSKLPSISRGHSLRSISSSDGRDDNKSGAQTSPGKKSEAHTQQLRMTMQLESEMNGLLNSVLKEEDRQRMIVKELFTLVAKNPEVFGKPFPTKELQAMIIPPEETMNRSCDVGIQVDEKDSHGAVSDLILSPRDEPDEPAPRPPVETAPIGAELLPFQLRTCMRSFSKILRIPPPAYVCDTIMAIYFDKMRVDDKLMIVGKPRTSLAEHVHQYFVNLYGIGSAADIQVSSTYQYNLICGACFKKLSYFSGAFNVNTFSVNTGSPHV
jgi:hypothetical protein